MIIKIIRDNNIDIVFVIEKEMIIIHAQKHIMQLSIVSDNY